MLQEQIFRSYDIRGVWQEEWDEAGVERIGRALYTYFHPKTVALGRDMRLSSPAIMKVLQETFFSLGVEVWDLGMISTDISYFVSGKWRPDLTIMITASHNPPQYNGLKYTLKGGKSISFASGGEAVKKLALRRRFLSAKGKGKKIKKDPYPEYKEAVLGLIEKKKIKPLKIVVDAGNGMAGRVLPFVFSSLPLEVIPLYFQLNGSFPHHLANPLLPEAVTGLKRKVKEEGADLGAAFDGDGDRMMIMDEKGEVFSGSALTAMIAAYFLQKNPGALVCYNAVCGRVVPETIKKEGGGGLRTPVGYSVIKKIMREKKAIFAGEHSYHFFFPSLYYADSGLTALLISLQIISQSGEKASVWRQRYSYYPASGEINFVINNQEGIMKKAEKKFRPGAKAVDWLDGLSLWYDHWWFNLRPSGTQPLLRLNVEADNKKILKEKTRLLVDFIIAAGGKRSFV